jgi:hypothetical protein
MGLITRLALSFACSFFLCSSASAAEPPAGIPEVGEVGRGQFSRFGFRVYEARLWAPSGRYVPHLPFALSLTYQRSIDGARIVQASLDEMAKLGVPIGAHPQWRDQWPVYCPMSPRATRSQGCISPQRERPFTIKVN